MQCSFIKCLLGNNRTITVKMFQAAAVQTMAEGRWDSGGLSPTQQRPEKSNSKFLIVGLGNHDFPGTRHSVGMQVVNKMASCLETRWQKDVKNFAGFVATINLQGGTQIVLLKPKMPMNVNGTSVAKTAQFFGIPADHVYLIHDDIDKNLGKLAIKDGGSANGHNGVKSVMNSLRADVMPRFKIGIDRPADRHDVAEYVLSDFPSDQQKVLNGVIDECIEEVCEHLEKRSAVQLKQVIDSRKCNDTDVVNFHPVQILV